MVFSQWEKNVSSVMELVETHKCCSHPLNFFVAVRVVGPLINSLPSKMDLSLEALTVFYGHRCAIDTLTGTFKPGSLVAIVGPNGGGKSTLLKAIKGQIPYKGEVHLPGVTVHDIAYLPQHAPLDRTFPLCVADVVAMGLCHKDGFYGDLSHNAKEKIQEALKNVSLSGFEKRFLHTLSGGQLQKVFFARLSLQNAPLILLDEPFAAVDAHTTQDLMAQVLTWKIQGRTVLMVSHDMELVRTHFDTTVIMAKRAMGWGPTQDVLTLETMRAATAQFRACEDLADGCHKRE